MIYYIINRNPDLSFDKIGITRFPKLEYKTLSSAKKELSLIKSRKFPRFYQLIKITDNNKYHCFWEILSKEILEQSN